MATTTPRPSPGIRLVTQEHVEFGSEPVALVGDPRHCDGLIAVRNPQDVPVKLRRIHLRTEAQEHAHALGKCGDPSVVEIKLSAGLCAGETQLLRVRAELPAGTPPGSYQARLEGGDGKGVPVTIQVLELRRTRLSPPTITYGPSSGGTFTVQLNAVNLGNVPALIPPHAPVELHVADRGWQYHFHGAVKSHGDQGHQAFLDAFVKRLGEDEPAVGRAKVLEGQGPLAPQQGRLLKIEIAMPKKLRTGRKYRGLVRLADVVFVMNLYITAEDETPSVPG
jgi:hypothetical protein